MNPNYAAKVEEIDKLLRVGFIQPVKQATWLRPIVVVPKKNGKILVCVDYWKLNAATVTDAFPLPFIDGVLDTVAGHEFTHRGRRPRLACHPPLQLQLLP